MSQNFFHFYNNFVNLNLTNISRITLQVNKKTTFTMINGVFMKIFVKAFTEIDEILFNNTIVLVYTYCNVVKFVIIKLSLR